MPKHSGKWISYLRVSTDKQGKSGLGIEAQRQAVLDYLDGGKWRLTAEYVEHESGRRSDRPELAKAIAACKKQRATLIIARLDRLARNVAFISNLMERKVPFVACDMPDATPMMLHIYSAVAEQEARNISERTKAALQAAKARGQVLGAPRRKLAAARVLGAAGNRRSADRFAANVWPLIQQIQATGMTTLRGIAAALTARGVATARGGTWNPAQVANVIERRLSIQSVRGREDHHVCAAMNQRGKPELQSIPDPPTPKLSTTTPYDHLPLDNLVVKTSERLGQGFVAGGQPSAKRTSNAK